jgi:hypothetical protein
LEVFGPRTRHGDRFARALLELIRAFPMCSGTARVLINEREYTLHLPAGLGEAIRWDAPDEAVAPHDDFEVAASEAPVAVARRAEDEARFDSEIERHLHTTLRGMERRGDAHGWTAEREPEPVIKAGTVFVPDFVLSRDTARVYVEVIGFWTPTYRDRKKAKLSALAEEIDLVLVIQQSLAPDFSGLPFPILPYNRRPSAVDLVTLLDRHFPREGPAEPTARDAARQLAEDSALIAHLAGLCAKLMSTEGVALERVKDAIAASGLPNAAIVVDHLESLLPRAGYTVTWDSLFDATVRPAG